MLAKSVVGATAEDEPGDEESVTSNAPQIPTDDCYQIVGTLQDSTKTKPDWVDEVFEVCVKCSIMLFSSI